MEKKGRWKRKEDGKERKMEKKGRWNRKG